MLLRQPLEHAARSSLKDAVNPRLRATAGSVVHRLCHRSRPELADAGEVVVQHTLNDGVVIRELRDDVRTRTLRVLHFHFHLLRAEDVLTHAILELAGQRVHRVNIVRRHRRVVSDVQEAPRHLIVDTGIESRLLPQLVRLQQRTQDAPAFPFTSRRSAVDDVDEVRRRHIRVALARAELHAAHEVGSRLRVPEHHGRVRDRIPLHSAAFQKARHHQAKTHERV